MNFSRPLLFLFAFLKLASLSLAINQPLDETKVFEWWDDGLVTPEEASEILDLIQEGNFEEACRLSETLALESCEEKISGPKKKRPVKASTPKRDRKVSVFSPEGYVAWTARMDSLGNLEKQFTDMNIRFYRYSLHLGSHSQLAYRNEGHEAYFGQIASNEFHSLLPTDTLWGTSVIYSLGNFQLQGTLDTSLYWNGRLGYKFQKNASASIFYWDSFRIPQEIASGGIQLRLPWMDLSGWYQRGQDFPLLKIRLHQKTTGFSWQTTAYFHGKDIPEISRLSTTLLKNRFSGTQQISLTAASLWNSRITANARLMIPQENDSLKGRLKVTAESGPSALRGLFSVTCLEAQQQCPENDFRWKVSSGFLPDFTLEGDVRSRHTRRKGFSVPRIQGSVTYHPADQIKARLVLQFPRGAPQEKTQIRTETTIGTNFIQSQLVVTFQRVRTQEFHPVHGLIQLKWLF